MSWLDYFSKAPESKGPDKYVRDAKGRFATKWGKKGFAHAGVQVTARGGRIDFNEAAPLVKARLVRQAVATLVKGKQGHTNITAITSVIAQATGSIHSPELGNKVAEAIRSLQKSGDIRIVLTTQNIKREGGHWVYVNPETKKTIVNPLTGKPGFAAPGEARAIATRDVHSIELTTKGNRAMAPKERAGFDLQQTLSASRPAKFDPVPGSTSEQALAIRRKAWPSSSLGPQGRVHASEATAPELLTVEFKGDKVRKKGEKTLAETYPNLDWYDATSSARANVGAMTGDTALLATVRLTKTNPKTPAMKTAEKLGIPHPDKPYYAILNPGGNGREVTRDMLNIGTLADNPSEIKKIVKLVDTPRLYGARASGTARGVAIEVIKRAGFGKDNPATPEIKAKATLLANTLVNNFGETPMAKFEAKFKGLAKEVPDNFVYTNPVNGFRMSFQKHDMAIQRYQLVDEKGKKFTASARVPEEPNKNKSANSAMPLFVQSMDAAVKDEIMVRLKNPFSKHDAFAVDRRKGEAAVKELRQVAADAYTKINRANPIGDLGEQMKKQWKAQIGSEVRYGGTRKKGYKYKIFTQADYDKKVTAINNAVNNFFPSGKPPQVTIPGNTEHLELE